ncbi:hypothetical protein JCM10296v2_005277 [Rhodotorula toruloides]
MDVDPAAAFLPADSPFDSGPTSYPAFDSTNSMSYGAPRSRACSTASSVNSFASSAFSTWTPQDSPNTSAHGRPSLEGTLATKLLPSCTGEGFVVDAGLAGRVDVGWQELVDLLLDPTTTSTLHPEHIVAQTASYLRARLTSTPSLQPLARPSTAVTTLGNGLHDFSFAPPPDPPHPYVQPALVSGSTAEPGSYDLTQQPTAGLFGQEPALALPTPPAQFCAPSDYLSHPSSSFRPPPLQRTLSTSSGPSSLRSLSPTRAPSFRSTSERDSFSARRRSHILRQTSSPYPYTRPPPRELQTAHLSNSSLNEWAGAGQGRPRSVRRDSEVRSEGESEYADGDDDYLDFDEEPGTAIPPELRKKSNGRRALRPLNRETETYVWSAERGQLSRLMPGEEGVEGEVIVFPAGSYCKVTVDDLDVLPSDTKHRVNEWLRGQTCVEGCTFRFEGKRPSVIRQHVTGCKARAQVSRVDPLKRLCQVQLDAQTVESRIRANARLAGHPKAPLDSDDSADQRSLRSIDSRVSSLSASSARSSSSYAAGGEGMSGMGVQGEPWFDPYASSSTSTGAPPAATQPTFPPLQHPQPQPQLAESMSLSTSFLSFDD